MGYTKHVDKGSRNPEPTNSLPIFLFLFYPPFLFCEMTESTPDPFPPRTGALSCFRAGRVTNLSKSVYVPFTHVRRFGRILKMPMREAAIPNRQTAYRSFFSFLPPL